MEEYRIFVVRANGSTHQFGAETWSDAVRTLVDHDTPQRTRVNGPIVTASITRVTVPAS